MQNETLKTELRNQLLTAILELHPAPLIYQSEDYDPVLITREKLLRPQGEITMFDLSLTALANIIDGIGVTCADQESFSPWDLSFNQLIDKYFPHLVRPHAHDCQHCLSIVSCYDLYCVALSLEQCGVCAERKLRAG